MSIRRRRRRPKSKLIAEIGKVEKNIKEPEKKRIRKRK